MTLCWKTLKIISSRLVYYFFLLLSYGCNHSDCDTCHDEYSWEQCEIMLSINVWDISDPRKEIFEGDVFYDEPVDEIGKVYYKDGCFFGKTDFFDTLLYKIASDIKIIGNIHENPDLLEGLNDRTKI